MIGDNEELARLCTALATTQAERDALAAELAALRTPVTDDALVKVVAKAICGVSCSATRRGGSGCECWDWQANELEARAVLAAVGPALVAAERERCASLEGAVRTSLSANGSACACGNGRVPVTAYRDACAAFAAAIRTGAPDAR